MPSALLVLRRRLCTECRSRIHQFSHMGCEEGHTVSDHSSALVPLETWCYASPELSADGHNVDIGLFAESLLYYDVILVDFTSTASFENFIRWFFESGHLSNLVSLMESGTVKIRDRNFTTHPVRIKGTYTIYNVQILDKSKQSFEERFLHTRSVNKLLPKHSKERQKIRDTISNNVVAVNITDFENAIANARRDFHDQRRLAHIVQMFVNEIFHFRKLGHPPEVSATVKRRSDSAGSIQWNVDIDRLSDIAGKNLHFSEGTPLVALAQSNNLIWSAALLDCDLYLPKPMSYLVGDKLYESSERIAKAGDIIDELKANVEFPDIRSLVNSGKLTLQDILGIRRKSRRFRDWLQAESERDRSAIIAYHNEVGLETGLERAGRRSLSIFGRVGGAGIGSAAGYAIGGADGAAIGAMAGGGISYLEDVAAKLGGTWKPVIFGDWMRKRIQNIIHDSSWNEMY
jgi:hypothetical protein